MSEMAKLISEYGILIVIAGTFLLLVIKGFQWGIKQVECLKQSHDRAVQSFIEVANDFNQTVLNHMVHAEEAHQAMMKTLEELCRYVQRQR